jgi:hypothetical protein
MAKRRPLLAGNRVGPGHPQAQPQQHFPLSISPGSATPAADMPATTYEFFVSNGAPQPATTAIRSHAMRTALQLRGRTGATVSNPSDDSRHDQPSQGSAANSRRTEQLKDGLKGRFRLGAAAGSSYPAKGKETNQEVVPRRVKRSNGARKGPTLAQIFVSGRQGHLKPRDAEVVQMIASDGASEIQWFGNESVDPFGIMPVEANWRVDMLVKFCEYTVLEVG